MNQSGLEFPNQVEIKHCQEINKRYGKTYYFASQFYPRKVREAIWCLYAFVRVPDEIVDDPKTERPIKQLGEWASDWVQAYEGRKVGSPVLNAAAKIWHYYDIPYRYSEHFLSAMAQDIDRSRYETLEELKDYMYGSASVVGLMVSHVIGYRGGEKTLEGAKLLGDAMQLTNFLRDIEEDIDERSRIYLPQVALEKFNVSEADLLAKRNTTNLKRLLETYVEMTEEWFEESEPYISYLTPSCQFPVKLASRLYRTHLDRLKSQNYEVFGKKNDGLSIRDKIKLTYKTWSEYRLYDRL